MPYSKSHALRDVTFYLEFNVSSSIVSHISSCGLPDFVIEYGIQISEYDQEIPQSHTADQRTAQQGRATGHKQ